MKHRKAIKALQDRQRAFEITENRQNRHDFKPNATGPKHLQHRPGSMQGKS